MAKMSDIAVQIEEALSAEGAEAVAVAVGVLQELPDALVQQVGLRVATLLDVAEAWLEEQA